MSPRSDIPPATGSERFAHLVAQERIVREARALTLRATMRREAPLPLPADDRETARDLRRGRMHPLGRVLWFLGILKARQHPEAREIAERLRDLVSEAIDLELPVTQTSHTPFRRPKPAHGAVAVRRGRIA